jgi:hypothetical protein
MHEQSPVSDQIFEMIAEFRKKYFTDPSVIYLGKKQLYELKSQATVLELIRSVEGNQTVAGIKLVEVCDHDCIGLGF